MTKWDSSQVGVKLDLWLKGDAGGQDYVRGRIAEAANLTGLSRDTIKNIALQKVHASPESWDALFEGIGPPIPIPPWHFLHDYLAPYETITDLLDLLSSQLDAYFINNEKKPLEYFFPPQVLNDLSKAENKINNVISEIEPQGRPELLTYWIGLKNSVNTVQNALRIIKGINDSPKIPSITNNQADLVETPFVQVPIFDAGAGEPSSFSDAGYPVGSAAEFMALPKSIVDENSFLVKIHGDSMEPTAFAGDLALVVPSASLNNGNLCFATWSDDEFGDRMVKRFRKAGETIVLESDNKKHDPIVLTETNGRNVRFYRITKLIKDV